MKCALLGLFLWSTLAAPLVFCIDNLKLNPHLDYNSDSLDGPLITGDDAQSGFVPGRPNYVIIYGEGCFNSKRQARRTVEGGHTNNEDNSRIITPTVVVR